MREQLRQPAIYARWSRRREIIEPPLGRSNNTKGFPALDGLGAGAVRTQWALLCTTLNLRVLYRRWRARGGGAGPRGGGQPVRGLGVGILGENYRSLRLAVTWQDSGRLETARASVGAVGFCTRQPSTRRNSLRQSLPRRRYAEWATKGRSGG